MEKRRKKLLASIKRACLDFETPQIVEVMSAVIGWASNRDRKRRANAKREREEDLRSGLEKAYGNKADL